MSHLVGAAVDSRSEDRDQGRGLGFVWVGSFVQERLPIPHRYLCRFWAEGRHVAELHLIQAASDADAQDTLANFTDQPDTEDQENEVTTVTSGALEVHVLKRWFPTNPQGEYRAMYFDEPKKAIVVLEVNSLDSRDFESYSAAQVADDLVRMLAAG